ncbi:MAG: endonuclease/exonuclease/phosphatase family protein [Myxococcota bacterium]
MKARLALTLATVPLLVACPAEESTDPTIPLALTTFNVGLAFGYVEEASGRIDPVIAAINASDADVICLQELWTNQGEGAMWTTEAIDRVLGGTAGEFPHQFWERTTSPEDAEPTGCTIEEAEPLETCAVAACGELPPENLADCVLMECPDEFNALSAGCQGCLVSNLGMPLADIVAACKGVATDGIVYDGHNGLAVLSRHPLEASEHLAFDYALTARSALHVNVAPDEGAPFDAYCTHLASDLSETLQYPEGGSYDSYAAENAAQTDALLGFVDDTATADTVALLGDFNHGSGELPDNYQRVLDAGFADPIAEADAGCSFCADNTLLEGATDVDDLIDHVYLMTNDTVDDARIVFDEVVDIARADGTMASSNLSDHYGVRVDLLR